MICGSREGQKVERRRQKIRDRQWTEADKVIERQQKVLGGCNMKMQLSSDTCCLVLHLWIILPSLQY